MPDKQDTVLGGSFDVDNIIYFFWVLALGLALDVYSETPVAKVFGRFSANLA